MNSISDVICLFFGKPEKILTYFLVFDLACTGLMDMIQWKCPDRSFGLWRIIYPWITASYMDSYKSLMKSDSCHSMFLKSIYLIYFQ